MKKVWKKAVSMTLTLVMLVGLMSCLTIQAGAANSGPEVTNLKKVDASVTLTPQDASGKAITASDGTYAGVEKFALTFTGAANAQHVVFLLNGENNNRPTENNIRFIDQKAAGANGNVSLTVYPDALHSGDYAVYASAASGLKLLATFTVEAGYIVGDIDGDGIVTPMDNMILARKLAGWSGIDGMIVSIEAADIDGDGVVTPLDNMILARKLAGWGADYDKYFE